MATNYHTNSNCEAWTKGKWAIVSVEFARIHPALVVRCLECHGPIVLMRAGRNNTTRAHAEHRPGHSGCSLGHYYKGIASPHPQKVVAPIAQAGALPESEVVVEDDESAFPEGGVRYKQHRYRERDGEISRRTKARQLAKTGKLACEVCGADFAVRYGKIGLGFIEAHHKLPISQLTGTTKTKMEDLALVCSNCHRMLHRGDPLLSVEALKQVYLRHNSKPK